MTYTPTERQPTGIAAAPLFMVSGFAKSGKSLTAYKLALHPRIHKCWVIDLGEGSADEYGGADGDPPYIVLQWGDTWSDLKDSVKWCCARKPPEGMLNAVIIDSGTEVWFGLSERAGTRARGSKKSRELLAKDPDAEIDTTMPFWNDAKTDWARIINPLKLTGHVVGVVLARSEMVAVVRGGIPQKEKVVSYQVEKTLQGLVTAHVTVDMNHRSTLLEVRSKHVSVGDKGMPLGDDNPLGEVLDLLSPSGGFAAPDARKPFDDGRDDPEIDEFWEKVLPHRSDDTGKALREFAAENNRELTKASLRSDRGWFENARDYLAQLEGATTP